MCFSSGSAEEEEEDRREKKYSCCVGVGLSHVLAMPHFLAKFLVCLATKISAFFIKIADFAPMGPAALLAAVAQLLAATSLV